MEQEKDIYRIELLDRQGDVMAYALADSTTLTLLYVADMIDRIDVGLKIVVQLEVTGK